SITNDAMARFVSLENSFREVEIKSFGEPQLFQKTFYPLINSKKANYVFQLNDFFVFVESEALAQELIGLFQNNLTLKNTAYFEKSSKDLSSSSSLLIFKMQGDFSETISGIFNVNSQKDLTDISLEEYSIVALQFSVDRNFAHVILSCPEAGKSVKNITD